MRLAAISRTTSASGSLHGYVGPGGEQCLQRLPLDELHREEGAPVRQGAPVVDGRDTGVLQLGGDAGLVREAAGGARVGRELVPQHLDGHLAAQDGVGGAVDDAHAAPGDLV
jgi:hypothetical protein